MTAQTDVTIVNNDNSKQFLFRAVDAFKSKSSQTVQDVPLVNTKSENTILFRFTGQKEEAIFKVANPVILFKKIQIEENNMFLLFLIDDEKRKKTINKQLSEFLNQTKDLLLRYIA